MRHWLETRLEALKREFETGQARLREVEAEQSRLQQTLLRISGAVQVLEEALEEGHEDAKGKQPDLASGGAETAYEAGAETV